MKLDLSSFVLSKEDIARSVIDLRAEVFEQAARKVAELNERNVEVAVILELTRRCIALETKLAEMDSREFNVKEFIRRCQGRWGFDVKVGAEMLEIAKYTPPVPADKPAGRITEQDAREIAFSYLKFKQDNDGGHYIDWLREIGRELLAKLNADRCPSHEGEQS